MVCEPEIVGVAAAKATVPELALNVPLFVQLPLKVKVLAPEKESIAPVCMVILLQTAVELMFGYPILPTGSDEGIITLVEARGTPPHQFPGLFQVASKAPVQVPGIQVLTYRIPEEAAVNQASNLLSAVEPVDP